MISPKKHKLPSTLLLVAILVTATLSGCASKLDEQLYQQEVQSFIEQTQLAPQLSGADEINWWHQLHSPQLNQLVSDALANNNDLHTSQLQLQSALARLGAQKADFLPQGGVNIAAQGHRTQDITTRRSSANLALSWELDLFGRINALVDAAAASAMGQAEQLRLLKIEIVSSVVNGYISYQGNKQKQHIISLQIEALEQSIAVLRARVEEGVADELDLNRTLAQLSQQQTLIPEISYAQYRDISTLAVLTGRITKEMELDPEPGVMSEPFTVSLAEPGPAIALRPDISRALYNFSHAHSLSVAASRALFPEISLSAFAGVLSLGNYRLESSEQQWQVAPQIQWSILSYPALLAQRDAEQYLSQAAYSEYQQRVLSAINEGELSLQRLLKQNEQKHFADKRYTYANNAFQQAKAMYEEGQIPYLQLLDARQDVLIAQENAVDLSIASVLAKVNVYKSFNGRWSSLLNHTPEVITDTTTF